MKERLNKGVVQHIIFALVFVAIAALWVAVRGYPALGIISEKALFKLNQSYLHDTFNLNDRTYAVEVYDMAGPIVYLESGEAWYLVGLEDGYYCLEVPPAGSEKISSMVENYKSLAENPEYISIRVDEDIYRDFRTFMDRSFTQEEKEGIQIWYDNILVYKASLASKLFDVGLTLVFVAFTIGFIYTAFSRRGINVESYELLYSRDPELRGNLELLPTKAEYSDEKLKMYVYKGLLIQDHGGFNVIDLENTAWIYSTIMRTKYYGVVTVATNFMINVYEKNKAKNKYKHKQFIVKKIKNYTEDALNNLILFIGDRHPDIILGFSKEAKEAYNNLKKQIQL